MGEQRVEGTGVAGGADALEDTRLAQEAGDLGQSLQVVGAGPLGSQEQEGDVDGLAVEGIEIHRLLQPGDEITIEIDSVGSLTNPVVGA